MCCNQHRCSEMGWLMELCNSAKFPDTRQNNNLTRIAISCEKKNHGAIPRAHRINYSLVSLCGDFFKQLH